MINLDCTNVLKKLTFFRIDFAKIIVCAFGRRFWAVKGTAALGSKNGVLWRKGKEAERDGRC